MPSICKEEILLKLLLDMKWSKVLFFFFWHSRFFSSYEVNTRVWIELWMKVCQPHRKKATYRVVESVSRPSLFFFECTQMSLPRRLLQQVAWMQVSIIDGILCRPRKIDCWYAVLQRHVYLSLVSVVHHAPCNFLRLTCYHCLLFVMCWDNEEANVTAIIRYLPHAVKRRTVCASR